MATPVLSRTAGDSAISVPLSPPQELLRIGKELYRIIAARAYQFYEKRGREQGQEISDWLQAETEIVSPCRHALVESSAYVMFRAELPGTFTTDQVKVSVEPRRVIITAQREVMIDYSSPTGHFTKPGLRRLFHIENLPVEVDPSRSRASLSFEQVEILMPRVLTAHRSIAKPVQETAMSFAGRGEL